MEDNGVAHHIGSRIRQARKEADLSQKRLAQRSGTSPASIIRWESGDTEVSISDLIKIARELGRPLRFFLQDVAPDQKRAERIGDHVPVVENKDQEELAVRLRDLVREAESCTVYVDLSGR